VLGRVLAPPEGKLVALALIRMSIGFALITGVDPGLGRRPQYSPLRSLKSPRWRW
jgi:hypothetical protein